MFIKFTGSSDVCVFVCLRLLLLKMKFDHLNRKVVQAESMDSTNRNVEKSTSYRIPFNDTLQ